jgi:hypothetical protein
MATYEMKSRIDLWKRVPTADGRGYTSVKDGYRTGSIRIEIDVEAIARFLGRKALLNRTRRSKGLSGMVKVQATNVKDHSDEG